MRRRNADEFLTGNDEVEALEIPQNLVTGWILKKAAPQVSEGFGDLVLTFDCVGSGESHRSGVLRKSTQLATVMGEAFHLIQSPRRSDKKRLS